MTSSALRQSFLDFFREKQHSIVPSSSLLPDSPNLLFTNAGMNQFVPIFLDKAHCPYTPPRAANSQKCIRAGGKHNDLEDVGLDTYHHTFFEMLGNWSFGDYFKKEAILWAWELLVNRWHFPANRLYATVYSPAPGDPSEFDEEAYQWWKTIFEAQQLDPAVHIVRCGRKDNFWMMGDTGPCGPCSEIHMDLTPAGDTRGSLVNQGSALCIEIWNLVFIQMNANPDQSFTPLPARHVDTGMGFERVASIMQGTQLFTDFSRPVSNYQTDLFSGLLAKLQSMSGKTYRGTLPEPGAGSAQQQVDIAFRVVCDHIRTLSMAIADGILPSNEGRGYVLRRILRRASRYGVTLGFTQPFLHELVSVVADSLGHFYVDVDRESVRVERTIQQEEENFAKTLERGLSYFDQVAATLGNGSQKIVSGDDAFKLYDTYGFPVDLTELVSRERGLTVDVAGFEACMARQKEQSRVGQKKEAVLVEGDDKVTQKTLFVGYDHLECSAKVLWCEGDRVVVDQTPFYAEMGGQQGDHGELIVGTRQFKVIDTQKTLKGVWIHQLDRPANLTPGTGVFLRVDEKRRSSISVHHSATHLLHWALREILGPGVAQKGSMVAPDRLRFDFTHHQPVSPTELAAIQELCVSKVELQSAVSVREVPYAEVRGNPSILQFFGDKYGETVRVVSIGDFSAELCGGTHVQTLSEVGFVKVIMESSVSSGVRRLEAVAGDGLTDYVLSELPKQEARLEVLRKKSSGIESLEPFAMSSTPRRNWQQLLARQEHLAILELRVRGEEKELLKQREAAMVQRAQAEYPSVLLKSQKHGDIQFLVHDCGDATGDYLNQLAALIGKHWQGVAILGAASNGRVAVLVSVHESLSKRIHAGRIIAGLAPIVGGKGGGRSTLAQAGGDQPANLPQMFSAVPEHIFN